MDMTLDFVELELENIVLATSTTQNLIDEMICRAQEDGITTPGYSYSTSYCADIYATIVRGANWTPQGGRSCTCNNTSRRWYNKCNLWIYQWELVDIIEELISKQELDS